MGWEAWTTLGVVGLVMTMLSLSRRPPDVILLGGLTILLTLGVLDVPQTLSGFANPGMVTVGALFVVTAGLRETGGMNLLTERLLGWPESLVTAQGRIIVPVAVLSAFMNNTPLVAMMLPIIHDWARKLRISTSKLLIPLSFASILGGTCTLIGTSTMLVVNGLIIDTARQQAGSRLPAGGLGMFDVAMVGLPCALMGVIYLLSVGRWLLPDRRPAISIDDDARQYTVEMIVEKGSPLADRTIEGAGLRHLPGLFLMEIDRQDQVLPAVSSNVQLREKDRLVFVGMVESVVDLQKIRGLRPATSQVYKLDEPRPNRALVEAVVSDSCPLVGRSIREGRFRTVYNAAVIAVARNGVRLTDRKIGDIVLQPGDTLLLEARAGFADQHRNSRDFFLVSKIEDSTTPRHERAWVSLIILGAMVASVTAGLLSMLNAALIASGAMMATSCCTASAARRNVDWQVLIVIASAFGIGRAMESSGAAQGVAGAMLDLAGEHRLLSLAVICAVTMVFTNVMNANAAAVLMFPIAMATAERLDASAFPFAIALMMGAACSFATPIGYQTNLMVYGPGGYRFVDYLRIGGPLSLIILAVSIVLIPLIWPF